MMKVIEKVREETSKGRFMLYAPGHIHLNGFSPTNVEHTKVRLGDPIVGYEDEEMQLYLAPEVLRGEPATEKSCNFNLAVIWDELLNNSRYFKTVTELESPTCNISLTQMILKFATIASTQFSRAHSSRCLPRIPSVEST
jgi:hypothetical protein